MGLATGLCLQMIKIFVEEEFKKDQGTTEGSIMRGNTIASKVTKAYLNIIGKAYLQEILGTIIRKIAVDEHKISLEIDPSKCESIDEAEKK